MSRRPPRVAPAIQRALDECGAPTELKFGRGDHIKIFVAGRLIGVVGHKREGSATQLQATLTSIRRHDRALTEQNGERK